MKRLLTLAILGAMSGPALAADLGAQGGYKDDLSNVVGPCAGVNWTGLRIGGLAGVGMTGIGSGEGTANGHYTDGESWTESLFTSGAYQMSAVGQLEVGYDHQFRGTPIVIGAFGNIGFGSGATEITYSGNLRAGFSAGNALFYGFGGWEKAHAVRNLSWPNGETIASMKADPDGFVYGAGVDVSLGRGWYAGVRAERADYGTLTAKGSANGVAYDIKTSATDDRGLLTLGYKF
jgi:hypothetical protein